MLDSLRPAARHALIMLLIAPASLVVGLVAAAIIAAAGVTGVDWPVLRRP